MSISLIPNTNYNSRFFHLSINHSFHTLKMNMHLNTPFFTTKVLPTTYTILEKTFPSVLQTRCFNSLELPFAEEVKQTEIAHLFEHILLENLCLQKLSAGHNKVCFNGKTHWNWVKYPKGSFLITINLNKTDLLYVKPALIKSIKLTELILSTYQELPKTIQS